MRTFAFALVVVGLVFPAMQAFAAGIEEVRALAEKGMRGRSAGWGLAWSMGWRGW